MLACAQHRQPHAFPTRRSSDLRGARGGGGDGEGGGGTILHRYRLTDRRAANFVTGVTEYSVSADGRKLLYRTGGDRKSTRLNSSHLGISYAVFCLKNKNTT